MDEGYFLDWLSLYQEYEAGSLPILGEDLIVTVDLSTGALKSQVVKGFSHEGSFSTSVQVRCDGTRVQVSGNPSAFAQPDNLFGVPSVRAGVGVFNAILREVGLPEFEEPEHTTCAPRQYARSDGVMKTGPQITRVDITKNLRVGDVRAAIRTLSGFVHQGEAGHLYPDGRTVSWGMAKTGRRVLTKGSSRQTVKFYDKGFLLRKKAADLRRSRAERTADEWQSLDEHVSYLDRLAGWCEAEGVLRFEVSIKSRKLADLGLQRLGAWDGVDMGTVIESAKFHKRLNVEAADPGSIFDELVGQGMRASRARACENAYRAWLSGADLRVGVSTATFYRMRSDLLRVGVDVATVSDVARLPVKVVRVGFHDVAPPSWYGELKAA